MFLLLLSLLSLTSTHLSTQNLLHLYKHLNLNLTSLTLCSSLFTFFTTLYFMTRPRKIYLLNFSCYKPEPERMCTRDRFLERSGQAGNITEENLAFLTKVVERSGLGQKTYMPEAILRKRKPSMDEARKDSEMVMFGAINELLDWGRRTYMPK